MLPSQIILHLSSGARMQRENCRVTPCTRAFFHWIYWELSEHFPLLFRTSGSRNEIQTHTLSHLYLIHADHILYIQCPINISRWQTWPRALWFVGTRWSQILQCLTSITMVGPLCVIRFTDLVCFLDLANTEVTISSWLTFRLLTCFLGS